MRLGTLPRIVLAIFVCASLAASAYAQTCEPPIALPQITAPLEVCTYTPADASVLPPAEGSWVAVSWSITNGTFVDAGGNPISNPAGENVRFVADNAPNPVTLAAGAVHSSGCETLQSLAEVPIRTIPAPVLNVPLEVCPYAPATASVQPPLEGTWQSVWWSISNGGFVDANGNPVEYPQGETVRFVGNGSGPVTLYASARDSFGCEPGVQGQAEVPIRTIPAPVLNVPLEVCPYTPATASVQPPLEGTWQAVWWSISNGGFVDANGNPVEYPQGETVRFVGNGNGPVTLYASARDSFGCESSMQGQAEVPIRTIPAPVLNVPLEVCPYTPAEASVQPPLEGTWQAVWWSISNGGFVDANGNPVEYPQGETVRFVGNGSGPVTLYASARDSFGCESSMQGQAEVAIRTIPAPVLNVPLEVCPYTPAEASVQPPLEGTWQAVWWSISNGGFVDANGNPIEYPQGESVRFFANGNGPVTLYASARDSFGCEGSMQGQAEVPIRTIPAPVLNVPLEVCPYAPAEASVQPPLEGTWQAVWWSIDNGGFVDANGNPVEYPQGESVRFFANGSGPVTLYASARDSFGCEGSTQGQAEVPIRTIDPPQITAPPQVCQFTPAEASVLPPAEGAWQNVSWSILNGGFVDASGNPIEYPNGETVRFIATGSGTVTLFASAQDSFGCNALQGTITIPVGAGGGDPPPSITLSSPNICGTEIITASVADGYTSYAWTVVNGSITSGEGTDEITFVANGAGPVTVSVTTNYASCPMTDSETLPLSAPPAYLFAPPSACAGAVLKAHAVSWYNEFSWTATNATIEGPADAEEVSFRATGAGPVILSFSGVDANGCFTSNSVTVPLNGYPTPNIYFSQGESLCPGGSGAAQADGYYPTYQWTITNAVNVTGQGTPFVTFEHVPGAGDVGVILNVGEGECTGYAARALPIRSTVPLSAELATPAVCANGDGTVYIDNYDSYSHVSLYATNGTITGTAPGRVPGGRTITFHNNGAGNTTILVHADSNSCLMAQEFTATMVAPPTATITAGGPTTFCAGGSVTLTASAGASYVWSNGATTQSINATASGSYTVTVTNANGCSATSAATAVTVNANPSTPAITPSGPTTFCQGGSVTLSAPAGFSYLWSNGATTQSIVASAPGAYSVTVTNANGCSATSAATEVTVTANPSTPAITPGGPTTFCQGGSVTLSAPAGFSYLWSNGATSQSIAVTASGSYSVTVANANGCTATSAPTAVTVNPLPAVPVITPSGSTNLCPGQNVTLTAPAGFSYLWSNGATTQSIVVSTAGSYSVTVTNANGCQRTSAATNVVANPPTVITTHPLTQTMPRNTTRVLSVVATGTATLQYQWYVGLSGNTSTPIAGATNSTLTIGPVSKKGTLRYWVRVTSTGCPGSVADSNTAVITVN